MINYLVGQMSERVPGCLRLDVTIPRSRTFFIKRGIPGNRFAQTELIQRHTNLWGWIGKKVSV